MKNNEQTERTATQPHLPQTQVSGSTVNLRQMTKKYRQLIFDKYKGKCAYCGTELQKGWHVDEIEPVRRNHKWNREKRRYEIDKDNPMMHPERLHIDNQNPSCASCNINKHSESLESFRTSIKGYMKHLNEKSTQYKIAKRYGLIVEKDIDVIFHFETVYSNDR